MSSVVLPSIFMVSVVVPSIFLFLVVVIPVKPPSIVEPATSRIMRGDGTVLLAMVSVVFIGLKKWRKYLIKKGRKMN